MLLLTTVAAILVTIAAVAYVVWPMVQPGSSVLVVEDDQLTSLIARKDATLSAIKDLEFDYSTGKLSDEDYESMDQRLRQRAIAYIKQIEKSAPESAQLDDRNEAEIAALRKTDDIREIVPVAVASQPIGESAGTTVVATSTDDPTASEFCTNCGNPLQPTHKFCARCGTPVQGR